MKLLHNNVMLTKVPDEETTSSGIYLGKGANNQMISQGIVVSVGPGKLNKNGTRTPPDLKEGDKVMYNAGNWHPGIDSDHIILPDTHILGIIQD